MSRRYFRIQHARIGLLSLLALIVLISGTFDANCSPTASTRTTSADHHDQSYHLKYVYWRNATRRTIGSVLPQPKVLKYVTNNEHDYIRVAPNELKFNDLLPTKCIVVSLALERYSKRYLFDDVAPEIKDDPNYDRRKNLGQLYRLDLQASAGFKCELIPGPNMDESYNLTLVPNDYNSNRVGGVNFTAILKASTSWGFLRGLETFSQLIFNVHSDAHNDQTNESSMQFAIQYVAIEDAPRFEYRGFMLDTARHYISVDKILLLLDAMAFNKLNVFHWHIVDDQSFPLVSKTYAQLSAKGSFRPKLVYTSDDVRFIIMYAAMRGIRVIPELDTPGHSYSLRHIPNVLSTCYNTTSGEPNGDFGPIDPTRPTAFKAIHKLLEELQHLFVDPYFHAGGDEVDFDCWRSNPTINKWMDAHNMSANYEALTNYYMRKLHELVSKTMKRKTMLVWQEVFDLGADLPPRDVVVSVWKYINDKPAYMRELATVVKAGYRATLSSCWYLNMIDYGQDWIKYYQCDPRSGPVPVELEHLVLGGEICMWSEFVDDTNVIQRTWPRASAAAERLWSPKEANNPDEFLPRLEQHRCRLMSRGIAAEPVNGPGYC